MVKGMLEALYGETNPETIGSIPEGDSLCITTV
jgi:hypothetical protein